jgi:hypothetical protein
MVLAEFYSDFGMNGRLYLWLAQHKTFPVAKLTP